VLGAIPWFRPSHRKPQCRGQQSRAVYRIQLLEPAEKPGYQAPWQRKQDPVKRHPTQINPGCAHLSDACLAVLSSYLGCHITSPLSGILPGTNRYGNADQNPSPSSWTSSPSRVLKVELEFLHAVSDYESSYPLTASLGRFGTTSSALILNQPEASAKARDTRTHKGK